MSAHHWASTRSGDASWRASVFREHGLSGADLSRDDDEPLALMHAVHQVTTWRGGDLG